MELHQKERLLENSKRTITKLQTDLIKEKAASESFSHALNKEREARELLDAK